jgi:hypothetical protein
VDACRIRAGYALPQGRTLNLSECRLQGNGEAPGKSRGFHLALTSPQTPRPYPGLVRGAAVLDWLRCMACLTESDLECDSSSVVRKSRTAALRCRTSFAIRGGRLRRADFSWIA